MENRKRQKQEKIPVKKRTDRRPVWWLWLPPAAAAGTLLLTARRVDGFGEWYVRHVYPLLAQPINRLTRLCPLSVMELLCSALLLSAPVLLVRLAVQTVRAAGWRARLARLGRAALRLLDTAAFLGLAFVLLAGVNYSRDSYADISGLPVQEASAAELEAMCTDLAALANRQAAALPGRDENDGMAPTRDVGAAVEAAYRTAAVHQPQLGGDYARPKRMYGSFMMSRLQLTGVFFPFTVEANYNGLVPASNVPFTAAHEMAHLRGFMREDEANYIAWTVCRVSDDPAVRYSGTLLSLIHAGNALYGADPAAYHRLLESYNDLVRRDMAENNTYWAQFDDTVLSRAEEKVNDAYLKANGQSDGTRSYGRMVDLLLAEWRANKGFLNE